MRGIADLLVLPPAISIWRHGKPAVDLRHANHHRRRPQPRFLGGPQGGPQLEGNLVTNTAWDDFWLNEGFTVYFEQRIMESVYGRDVSEMLATLSYQGLVDGVDAIMDLNPDDTSGPAKSRSRRRIDRYRIRQGLLLCAESMRSSVARPSTVSRPTLPHAFSVMDTDRFIDYLKSCSSLQTSCWLLWTSMLGFSAHGLPDNCPTVSSARIERVDAALAGWEAGTTATSDLPWNEWVYRAVPLPLQFERCHFP